MKMRPTQSRQRLLNRPEAKVAAIARENIPASLNKRSATYRA